MKTMIIEDSRLARAELKEFLTAHPEIELCAEAENPRDALPIIQREMPELLLLDINMPGATGLELLQQLDYEPKVIFITAHADYAVQSFEFNTLDYLLKPVSAERLKKALEKAGSHRFNGNSDEKKESAESTQNPLEMDSRVMLRDGENCYWVTVRELHYFESCGNYTQAFWNNNKALIYRALGKIEARLPARHFFRASRQHIVNTTEIAHVSPWVNGGFQLQLKSGATLEVSRRHSARFRDLFSL